MAEGFSRQEVRMPFDPQPLLNVAERITAHPEALNMEHWITEFPEEGQPSWCNTVACVAGWLVVDAGWAPIRALPGDPRGDMTQTVYVERYIDKGLRRMVVTDAALHTVGIWLPRNEPAYDYRNTLMERLFRPALWPAEVLSRYRSATQEGRAADASAVVVEMIHDTIARIQEWEAEISQLVSCG